MADATILVCDDDHGLRELMKVTLSPRYRVVEAADGQQAREALAAHRPDLVLLDVMLPGDSGLQVLEAIRNDDELHDVPVIVVSAWQTEEDKEAATRAGADAFLGKPFELEELTGSVAKLIAGE